MNRITKWSSKDKFIFHLTEFLCPPLLNYMKNRIKKKTVKKLRRYIEAKNFYWFNEKLFSLDLWVSSDNCLCQILVRHKFNLDSGIKPFYFLMCKKSLFIN